MSPDLRKGTGPARAVPVTAAVLALVGLLVAGGPAAAVAPAGAGSTDVVTLTADGTLVQLVVEHPDGSHGAELDVRSVVEVGTVMLTVPPELADPDGRTGDDVTVVLEAQPGLGLAEVLVEAAVPQDGDVARVVEVLEAPTAGTAEVGEQELAAAAIGVHTLVVLPVYWTAPDSATVTTLQGAATRTADYWSEQSGGRIAVQTQVRGWAPIADPGGCDVETLWSRALAAHGITQVQANQHLLVYFPNQASCGGWAGMASLGGGQVWVNGWTQTDVWAHELGHNFGLGHANRATCTSGAARVSLTLPISGCTVSEYADRADVMGIALTMATGNLNSAMADYLGLATVVRPVPGATTVVDLQPLASVDAVRSVAVPVAGGTVYVDFRPAIGRDVRMPAWAGVQVHLRTPAAGGVPTTYLLDMVPGTLTPFASPALPAGAAWAIPGTTQVVSVTRVGATATVSVGPTAAVSPAVAAYVSRVYRHLFDRDVDPVGLATWSGALATGTPRVAVANAITSSDEYRLGLIAGSYQTYLLRAPDPVGHQAWLGQMRLGVTIQRMEAGFLASDEYYSRAGGTDAGWVAQLYRHVLGREAAPAEVAGWTGVLAAGGGGRGSVALGFLLSTEHLVTVVDGYYQQLLGRGIDPTGSRSWVAAIQGGHRVEEIIGGIVASEEYFGLG